MGTITICVYGDFKKGDIRIKIFEADDREQYRFQNTLKSAGYDAELFTEAIKRKTE